MKEAIFASSGGSLLSNTLIEPSLQPAANILFSVKNTIVTYISCIRIVLSKIFQYLFCTIE